MTSSSSISGGGDWWSRFLATQRARFVPHLTQKILLSTCLQPHVPQNGCSSSFGVSARSSFAFFLCWGCPPKDDTATMGLPPLARVVRTRITSVSSQSSRERLLRVERRITTSSSPGISCIITRCVHSQSTTHAGHHYGSSSNAILPIFFLLP